MGVSWIVYTPRRAYERLPRHIPVRHLSASSAPLLLNKSTESISADRVHVPRISQIPAKGQAKPPSCWAILQLKIENSLLRSPIMVWRLENYAHDLTGVNDHYFEDLRCFLFIYVSPPVQSGFLN